MNTGLPGPPGPRLREQTVRRGFGQPDEAEVAGGDAGGEESASDEIRKWTARRELRSRRRREGSCRRKRCCRRASELLSTEHFPLSKTLEHLYVVSDADAFCICRPIS